MKYRNKITNKFSKILNDNNNSIVRVAIKTTNNNNNLKKRINYSAEDIAKMSHNFDNTGVI